MFFKLMFVVATLCVVNASVIVIKVFDDDLETELATNLSECNWQACDQLCRRLKFPGGACVNGRCKCDNFRNTEDNPEAEVATKKSQCNYRACDQQCRRLGFTGGACVNGRCKCDNFLNAEDDIEAEVATKRSQCNYRACDQQCRRLGFTGGACVNGRCKCDNFLNAEDELSEKSVSVSETSERGCNPAACDQLCRRLKFHGGTCVNGRCKCDNFLTTEDTVSESSENVPKRPCNSTQCYRSCRHFGYKGGKCVNGRCKCNNTPHEKDALTETALPVFELAELFHLFRCNTQMCDKHCSSKGFPGGSCIKNRCKCNDLITEDPSPIDDATSDEDEDSNLVLKTSEGELTVPSLSACNTVNCNDMCHRLNYAGGLCRGGVCQCY